LTSQNENGVVASGGGGRIGIELFTVIVARQGGSVSERDTD
jgi:hypothetical protein